MYVCMSVCLFLIVCVNLCDTPFGIARYINMSYVVHSDTVTSMCCRGVGAQAVAARPTWVGQLRRSAAKTAYMRQCRETHSEQKKRMEATHLHDKLADAWDGQVLRDGDKAARMGLPDADIKAVHPNQFDPKAVVRLAFNSFGADRGPKHGVFGTTHMLGMASVVARACIVATNSVINKFFEAVTSRSVGWAVIHRHYDSTPMKATFGKLQAELAPSARYLVPAPEGSGKKWRSVRIDEYMRLRGRNRKSLPARGVVDVLAQTASLSFGSVDGQHHRWNFLLPPILCQNGTASCIFAAVDEAVPALSMRSIMDLSKQLKYMILNEVPDMCPSNTRKKADTAERLPRNCFFADGQCSCHKCHRIIASATDESKLIGDIHAVTFAATLVTQHEQIMKAYWEVLLRDFEWIPCAPPLEFKAHRREIWRHCRDRTNSIIRGGLLFGEALMPCKGEAEIEAMWSRVSTYVNGNVKDKTPHHFCTGCCRNKAEARENFYAAVVEASALLDSIVAKPPTKSRWGTCCQAAAAVSLGIMWHECFPQAVSQAFPNYAAADAAAQQQAGLDEDADDIDAMRRTIRNKTYRMTKVCETAACRQTIVLTSWIASPLDHLIQRVQHVSERPGALRDILKPDASPFMECRVGFRDMLMEPIAMGPLATPLWYFDHSEGAFNQARGLILNMAGQLRWRFLNLETWPFLLARLASADRGQARAAAHEFMSVAPCCLDRDFGLKVTVISHTSNRFLN